MSIRDRENALFKTWMAKEDIVPFIIDGAPDPEKFENSDSKVLLILKDANMGESYNKAKYDQRDELENCVHKWWQTIARWCYLISNKEKTWVEAKEDIKAVETWGNEGIRDAIGPFAFIQLKKQGGLGNVSNDSLWAAIERDTNEIKSQIAIYSPNFIVCCGNGDMVSYIYDLDNSDKKYTDYGVGYWSVQIAANNFQTYIIDYCHPSIRVGTKVSGLIAKGISDVIHGLANR